MVKCPRVHTTTFLLLLFMLNASACGGAPEHERPSADTTDTRSKTLVDLTDQLPRLDRFRFALRVTGAMQTLEGAGPFTVFAPLDQGFLRDGRTDSVFAPALRDSLRKIVRRHIVRGTIAGIWQDSVSVATMSDDELTLRQTPGGITIEDRPILQTFVARNGLIHIIPSSIASPPPDSARSLLPVSSDSVKT